MKIYNEVVTKFNEITGKWETISENSFNYSGIVHFAQGLPPGASPLNESDKFADTTKITTGYFTGGDATFNGTEVFKITATDAQGPPGGAASDTIEVTSVAVDDSPASAAPASTTFLSWNGVVAAILLKLSKACPPL